MYMELLVTKHDTLPQTWQGASGRTGGVFGWGGCSAGLRGVGGCTFKVCLKLRKVLQKFRTTSYSTTKLGVEPFDVWCSQSSVMVRCSAPLVSFVC